MRRIAGVMSGRIRRLLLLAAVAVGAPAEEPDRQAARGAGDRDDPSAFESRTQSNDATSYYDEIVFGHPKIGFAGAAKARYDVLRREIVVIDLLCDLTADQKKKLELAGKGDVQRLLERIEKQRAEILLIDDLTEETLLEIFGKANREREAIDQNPFREGSLFNKMLDRSLTADQAARLAPFSNARWLAQAVEVRAGATDREQILGVRLSGAPVVDDRLAGLARLTRLQTLSLDATQITDAGLVHLAALPRLEQLDLSGTGIAGPGLVHLKRLGNLQKLSLEKTHVSGPGLEHLAGLPTLKTLRLGGAPITDDGIESINQLNDLECLSLRGTRVTDAGLAGLPTMHNLRVLDLDTTGVGDTGLAQLAALKNLRMLDLRATRVTDVGLAHLATLENLQYVCLFKTQVTAAGIASLREKLPRLRADW
jgi:hypothetical protein